MGLGSFNVSLLSLWAALQKSRLTCDRDVFETSKRTLKLAMGHGGVG